MKWGFLLFSFVFSFNLLAASIFPDDIRLLKEAVHNYPVLMQNFRSEILPLVQKTKNNPQVIFTIKENEDLQKFWSSYHDLRMVLGVILANYKDQDNSNDVRFIKYLSSLMLLNSATEIVTSVWDNPLMRKKLDFVNPKEVPQGTFHSMENEIFKNVHFDEKTIEFDDIPTYINPIAVDEVHGAFVAFFYSRISLPSYAQELFPFLQEQEKKREFFRPFLESFQNRLTLKARNISYLFMDLYYKGFTKISTWLGDTKVFRRDPDLHYGNTYIKKDLAEVFLTKLQPGDLVISRGNWFLSNIFLPGFWPHSTIYLGEPSKLKNYFDTDSAVLDYFQEHCQLEALPCYNLSTYLELSAKTKNGWQDFQLSDSHGEAKVLIEATSDGVILSSVYSYMSDFLGGMRPQLSKLEKAKAIVEAFKKFGLEYDFDFDLRNEDRLVCSALLDKSYRPEPAFGKIGLHFEKYYTLTLGRPGLPPTNLATKTYDERGGMNQELKFVAFLKGDKRTNSAIFAAEQTFYDSRAWPKWSFMQK